VGHSHAKKPSDVLSRIQTAEILSRLAYLVYLPPKELLKPSKTCQGRQLLSGQVKHFDRREEFFQSSIMEALLKIVYPEKIIGRTGTGCVSTSNDNNSRSNLIEINGRAAGRGL